MPTLRLGLIVYFAINICIEDLRIHKIRNRILMYFLCFLFLFSLLPSNSHVHPIAAIEFSAIFIALYLASNALHKSGGIGFGDVKLLFVLAFAFFDPGLRSIEIFFISLWIALIAHISLYLLMHRKYPHRIAMAPDLFLASGLYMYAPIGLLVPQ